MIQRSSEKNFRFIVRRQHTTRVRILRLLLKFAIEIKIELIYQSLLNNFSMKKV